VAGDENLTVAHYQIEGLVDRVRSALGRTYGNLDHLTCSELRSVDSFHIRGLASTKELAGLVGILPRWRVLDVGSGPGGTARHLAAKYNCTVTGMDITPAYVALAEYLSHLTSLSEVTTFECGDALSMPFGEGGFDCVWMEHVQMNIPEKSLLISETYRVLKHGGRLAMQEVFSGEGGDPFLPSPWSGDLTTSFMTTAAEMRQTILAEGFKIAVWRDVTAASRDWFRSSLQRIAEAGFPAVGIHLLMGPDAHEKMMNVKRSLEDNRLTVVQAVMDKPV